MSGINPGLNTGRAILHSGTVGAALTAQNFGGSGLAVSLDVGDRWYWETAAARSRSTSCRALLEAPARTVLNLNVPALPYDEVGGVRWARLAAFGAVRAAVADHARRRAVRTAVDRCHARPRTPIPASSRRASPPLTTIVGIAEAWPSELHEGVAVAEGVVPGAPLEPVHPIPDGSLPRWLHRPIAPT